MAVEYISRSEVISRLYNEFSSASDHKNYLRAAEVVCNTHAEKVVPTELYMRALTDVIRLSGDRSGEWLNMMGHLMCNLCGYKSSPIPTNYCPNCGAKMGIE